MSYPLPANESERLRVLESYGILDTPAEEAFDRISRFAARLFDVPISLVSLIDRNRQFLKSCFGIEDREMPRGIAFCAHTILSPGEILVVEDASKDPRFAFNRLVTGAPHIRFYAGVPLLEQFGTALGSFCIIDNKPRSLSSAEERNLRDLAAMVEDEIRLRERTQAAEESEQRYQTLHQAANESLEHIRENLVWMIPHELMTPLNGVLGFTELLQVTSTENCADQVRAIGNGLRDASSRLERGVRNICLLSHLEIASADPKTRSRLDAGNTPQVDRLIGQAATAAAQQAQRTDDLNLRLEAGAAEASELFLAKAVEELVENAFKFSVSGTPVRVEGKAAETGYLLTIADQGRGMSRQQIAQIDAFMQFDRDRFEQQGMGIGLVLARKISELLGFSFRIESQLGVGTTVRLCLPPPFPSRPEAD